VDGNKLHARIRDNVAGKWLPVPIGAAEASGYQVREMIAHRDELTGAGMVFLAANPNAVGLQVGDIAGINKKGWENLRLRYADAEDEETLIKQPVAAYVERV
jgi:hypothetical protein